MKMVAFNGSNWAIWKPRMEDFLSCKDLEGPLLGDSAHRRRCDVVYFRNDDMQEDNDVSIKI